ncbi:hypothetical protein KAI58_04220 [Candidatus Gracilibacteria bacterium]|nr:hypothetical protein [Candidatus Gracilibacteria bacterium]
MEKTKITFSSRDSLDLIKAAFSAFPKLWWRIGVVNIFSVLMILIGMVILFGSLFLLLGGISGIESIVVNLKIGGQEAWYRLFMDSIYLFLGGIAFLVIWLVIFGSLWKISNLLTIKNYVKKTTENPFQIYFVQSWIFLWRYLLLVLRTFWYVIWPVLLILAVVVGIVESRLLHPLSLSMSVISIFSILIFIFLLLIWRKVNVFCAKFFLVHFNEGVQASFKGALSVVKGNFWFVFLSLFVLVLCLIVLKVGLFYLAVSLSGNLRLIVELLDFLIGFFILPPIVLSFMYFLMVHMVKKKQIR